MKKILTRSELLSGHILRSDHVLVVGTHVLTWKSRTKPFRDPAGAFACTLVSQKEGGKVTLMDAYYPFDTPFSPLIRKRGYRKFQKAVLSLLEKKTGIKKTWPQDALDESLAGEGNPWEYRLAVREIAKKLREKNSDTKMVIPKVRLDNILTTEAGEGFADVVLDNGSWFWTVFKPQFTGGKVLSADPEEIEGRMRQLVDQYRKIPKREIIMFSNPEWSPQTHQMLKEMLRKEGLQVAEVKIDEKEPHFLIAGKKHPCDYPYKSAYIVTKHPKQS